MTHGTQNGREALLERMRAAGQPEVAIQSFAHHYDRLLQGSQGMLREQDIEPVTDIEDAESLDPALAEKGRQAIDRVVVIKLNGGLGTSMGMRRAKSLLPVRQGRSFLELIVSSCAHVGAPLLLMNSFSTRADTLTALDALEARLGQPESAAASRSGQPESAAAARSGLPRDFLQHKVPKVLAETLGPVTWPDDPDLEWCPPGHGDLYPALLSSGALDVLLAGGFDWAFVSNADNLGAVVDLTLLGFLAERQIPFLMEVADRTLADRKGGHLARRPGGGLLLRERAQVPDEPEAVASFEDVTRHRTFNTNNLWLHLPTLARLLRERGGVLGLSLIVNRKTVDPRNLSSPEVLQLESAMGAALSVVPGARALRVSRRRFAPVKTTADLLAVRSDAYVLTEDARVVPSPARDPSLSPLDVRLDPRFYRLVDQLDARFPQGPPSLLGCASLAVRGNVRFGRGVVCRGDVTVLGPEPVSDAPPGEPPAPGASTAPAPAATVPPGATLRGTVDLREQT